VPNYKTITRLGSVSRAKDFLENQFWICLGRTTPWNQTDTPPEASTNTTTIDEPILYKRITQAYFVKPVASNGDFYIEGTWYDIITEAQARSELISYVILVASISYEDIGDDSISFRQVGIFSRLVPKEGYEEYTILTPDQVDDPGWLEWYANLEPIMVQPNQSQTFYIIIVM
jgi:hypothetical protein